MAHSEPSQLFSPNGEAIPGGSILREAGQPSVDVGDAHVWIWRRTRDGRLEVLLQKRSKDKASWSGHLDISAAGRIDAGETPIQAAIRECSEEISLNLIASQLMFLLSYRNFENGIKWVYLYEITEPVEFIFADGEVESLDWITLSEFKQMVMEPNAHGLVPHPSEYFTLLVKALERYE